MLLLLCIWFDLLGGRIVVVASVVGRVVVCCEYMFIV